MLTQWVPIAGWIRRYRRQWAVPDLVAGLTIWGLLIPEMIAYANLAGLPPQAGLYTLLASLPLYAVFGTSRHLVVAGTSASAVLVFSAVSALHPQSASSYTTLAAGMIVLAGIVFIAGGLLRLGFVTSFLSRPVMDGFIFGLAVFVTVSQLPKLFGIEKGPGDTVRQFAHLVSHLSATNGVTFCVGLGALVLLFGLERYVPRIPGGLVVLVLGLAISAGFDLSSHGVAIVGTIPKGLPSVSWPALSVHDLWVLLPSAAGMVLVIFSEALGAGETFAEKHGYRLDSNQEMIALGLANLGSGILGGLAAGGSLSQSAVNEGAGARSEMSPLVASALALLTVVALTPLFKDLPEAVLAALIIHAVSHLMKVSEMRRYYRLQPREFWLGMLTLGGVVVLDVLPGLIIGVVTAVVLLVYRASRAQLSILGLDPEGGGYVDVRRHPAAQQVPGLLLVRPQAPMFYANAKEVREAITAAVSNAPGGVHHVVLDLDANDQIDITSAQELAALASSLGNDDVVLALAHVHQPVLTMLGEAGVLKPSSPVKVFADLGQAGKELATETDS